MISIIISIIIAVSVTAGVEFLLDAIGFSITIGLISGIVYFLYMTKKVTKELEKINDKAQKAIQTQNFDRAIKIYETGLSLKNKGLLVEAQVHSFTGMLYYIKKDKENAFKSLKKATSFNWVAKGMLAIMYMQNKELDLMEKTFEKMTSSSKKEGLVWGLYAYCLVKLKRTDEAIRILEKGLTKMKSEDERLKVNILELKNGRKMKMKVFGDPWYQFMLEQPPKRRMQQQAGPQYGKIKKNQAYR